MLTNSDLLGVWLWLVPMQIDIVGPFNAQVAKEGHTKTQYQNLQGFYSVLILISALFLIPGEYIINAFGPPWWPFSVSNIALILWHLLAQNWHRLWSMTTTSRHPQIQSAQPYLRWLVSLHKSSPAQHWFPREKEAQTNACHSQTILPDSLIGTWTM